jgi:signal transduction histidine kinase
VNDSVVTAARDRRQPDRLDLALLATVAMIIVGAGAALAIPGLRLRIMSPSLDLVLDSVALVVTGLIGSFAWLRFRERHYPFGVYQAAAFLGLAIGYAHAVVVTVRLDLAEMLSVAEPGQDQLYVFLAARLAAAAVLVIGGISVLQGRTVERPELVLVAPALVVCAVILVADLVPASLPLIVEPTAGPASLPVSRAVTPLGSFLHLAGACLMLAAVIVSRRVWRRDNLPSGVFITVGLLMATFALVVGALAAGTHPGPVTAADLLWLGFDISLLLAVEAGARDVLRQLHSANESLAELREADVARAALEERIRLSRELHDGLTQDLWLAKLKIGRLGGMVHGDPAASALLAEASGAVDKGLAEAHQAVMATRIAAATDGTFGQLLARYAEDFEDRFGIRVRVELDPTLPELPAREQAELLRIAQEALVNVHRHAHARLARVQARADDHWFVLTVIDDGRGFDASQPRPTDFGLLAMRERAALLGGDLRIESSPGRGTRVEVRAPVARSGVTRPEAIPGPWGQRGGRTVVGEAP